VGGVCRCGTAAQDGTLALHYTGTTTGIIGAGVLALITGFT